MEEKAKDICVLCGEETTIDSDTHIDARDFYVEGVGQLCWNCWNKIYGDED